LWSVAPSRSLRWPRQPERTLPVRQIGQRRRVGEWRLCSGCRAGALGVGRQLLRVERSAEAKGVGTRSLSSSRGVLDAPIVRPTCVANRFVACARQYGRGPHKFRLGQRLVLRAGREPALGGTRSAPAATRRAIAALLAGRARVELSHDEAEQALAWAASVDGWDGADRKPVMQFPAPDAVDASP
jgi:hypothetical protein